jgi:FkbM family methyltransferase
MGGVFSFRDSTGWVRAIVMVMKVFFRSGLAKTAQLVGSAVRSELSDRDQQRIFNVPVVMVPGTRAVNFSFRGRSSDLTTILDSAVENNLAIPSADHQQLVLHACAGILRTGSHPIVLDLGSNIGSSAAYLARRYPGTYIYGFEPNGGNYELAVRNSIAFGENVKMSRCAVGAEDGVTVMERVQPDGGRRNDYFGYRIPVAESMMKSGYGPSGDTEQIDIISPKTIASRFTSEDVPFLLKVDIESGERAFFEAVQADPTWWQRFPVVIVEIHDWMYHNFSAGRSFLQYHLCGTNERLLLQNATELFSLDVLLLEQLAGNLRET